MAIFDSAVRTNGDLAGVSEYEDVDGPQNATAYFYLCETAGPVVGAIHIRSGAWSIAEADIAVKWDRSEQRVGLVVFGVLTAAFDAATGTRYGGRYGKDFNAKIPWS
ncbi:MULTISPECIES: hypothetical protein [unclassified Mesorhizobium]|uniref:hypothetical protein n=1 Tax=unclassified Mesorhizobium TaxID=325217 RepID=UPI000FCC6CDC|nr:MULTISPECIES: hypothetical protein [unclassified Mesorhizobium]RUW31256.1 hypothetical protein EOA38_18345 [Mesorhizobium sp. M1E.F.Ca.ET.041.01.1.1]RWD85692.1 MAG: hypothetical protein EOS38_21860 [Mesorhizobium sp.]RWD91467.1 MAG: hypothetical protein EOS39_17360 [Mesorhizobium sp.]TIV50223.1 MAG: hypothetical protein E5V88_21510 [Mesorhizobium sp.]